MGFAPKAGGEVLPFSFEPEFPDGLLLDENRLRTVRNLAYDFWERVARDQRISVGFREFLQQGNPIERMPKTV